MSKSTPVNLSLQILRIVKQPVREFTIRTGILLILNEFLSAVLTQLLFFFFTVSTDSNSVPQSTDFTLRKLRKSHGARFEVKSNDLACMKDIPRALSL